MATGYDVSALGAYTKDSADKNKVLYKHIAEGDSAQYFSVMTGVKSSENIHLIETAPVWQVQACGFTASANTAFSNVSLSVSKIGIYMDWCEKDLESKYTQLAMKAGSDLDMLTFEKQITEEILMKNRYKKERAIWLGNTLSTDQDLLHFDGFVKLIAADSDKTVVTPGAWSVANARTRMQEFASALTNDMLNNQSGKVFMGSQEYRDYRLAMINANLYHNAANGPLTLEGTDIEIVPTIALSGTKKIYFMPTEYAFIGTDLENEFETFSLEYAKEARKIRFILEFKMGVKFVYGSLIASMLNT